MFLYQQSHLSCAKNFDDLFILMEPFFHIFKVQYVHGIHESHYICAHHINLCIYVTVNQYVKLSFGHKC